MKRQKPILNSFHLQGKEAANKQAFTLVELIVVITILAILGTIGFINLQGFSSSSRDSKRISELTEIRSGLQIYQARNGVLPTPSEQSVTIGSGSTNLIVQGYAGISVLNEIRMNGEVKDPLDNEYYIYSTNGNQTKFQLLSLLENNDNLTSSNNLNIIPTTYASYENRYPYTLGQNVCNILEILNIPLNKTQSGILDLSTDTNEYKLTCLDTSNIEILSGIDLYNEIVNQTNNSLITQTNELQEPTYSCETEPNYTNANFIVGEPTSENQAWQNTNDIDACYYECINGYTGSECITSNINFPTFFSTAGFGNSKAIVVPLDTAITYATVADAVSQINTYCTGKGYVGGIKYSGSTTDLRNTVNWCSTTSSNCLHTAHQNWEGNSNHTDFRFYGPFGTSSLRWRDVNSSGNLTLNGNTTTTHDAATSGTLNIGDYVACQTNIATPTYTVSGSLGSLGAGATVRVCGAVVAADVTADSNGNFSRTGIPHGTICNNILATRTDYLCSITQNGPNPLISNISNVTGSCIVDILTQWGDLKVGTINYLLVDRPDTDFVWESGTSKTTSSTVRDTITGLHWESVPDITTRTWSAAKTRCAGLTKGGFSDWRLPNIVELESIVDYSRTDGVSYWYDSKFTLGATGYWSSTTNAGNTVHARFLNFSDASNIYGYKLDTKGVICTR